MTRALALYRELGDQAGQGDALKGLGLLHGLTGDFRGWQPSLRQALGLFREISHRRGEAQTLNELDVEWITGTYRTAAAMHREALHLFRDIGDQMGEGDALLNLGVLHRLTGDYMAAAEFLQQALSGTAVSKTATSRPTRATSSGSFSG